MQTNKRSFLIPVHIPPAPAFPDPHIKWLSEVVTPWDGSDNLDVGIVGIPFDRGVASHRQGARFGPKVVREELYASSDYCIHHDVSYSNLKIQDLGNIEINVMDYHETQRRVERVMANIFNLGVPILTIGGDHSLTGANVRSFCRSIGKGKKIGVIDFDTHHDVREGWGENSGLWSREILSIAGRPLRGENFVQIGVHGYRYSAYYHQKIKEYGIKTFTPLDIRHHTMEVVVDQALRYASDGTDAIYVTVDIDVLDQTFAPGTNASYPGGLVPQDLMVGVNLVGNHPIVRTIDLMEVSPPLDFNNLTARQGVDVLLSFLCGYATRRTKGKSKKRGKVRVSNGH